MTREENIRFYELLNKKIEDMTEEEFDDFLDLSIKNTQEIKKINFKTLLGL